MRVFRAIDNPKLEVAAILGVTTLIYGGLILYIKTHNRYPYS